MNKKNPRSIGSIGWNKNIPPILKRPLKFTILSLLMCLLFAFEVANSQRISLRLNNEMLSSVINKLETQSGYNFWYEDAILKNAKRVTVNLNNVLFEEALKRCFESQPITYSIVNNTVVLKGKPASTQPQTKNSNMIETNLADIIVKGQVIDAEGKPLAGISVTVKSSRKGTSTAEDGTFTLDGVDENSMIEFSGVGFEATEMKVSRNMTVILKQLGAAAMDEVVITGYGTMDRKMFTGSSTKLLAKDAERIGVPDVSRMLEGQVAGVSVQNVSGTFGAAPKIRIRGATSISGDNKPLWVVDGIILEDVVNISNEQLSTGDANTLIGSSVAGLNPDDIESFTILKDAAATAMYGARAMNGVIVITTKKGKATEGKPQLSLTSNFTSYLKPSYKNYNIMNSADQMGLYLEAEQKGFLNQASVATSSSYGVFGKMYNEFYDVDPNTLEFKLKQTPEDRDAYLRAAALRNTDWFDILFKNSLQQEHSVSLTSGTQNARVYASASFLDDNGWTTADRVKRYTGNVRGDFNLSKKISLGLIATGSVRDQVSPGTQDRLTNVVSGEYERDFDNNPFSYVMNNSRTLSAFEEDGSLTYYQKNYAPYNIIDELANNGLQTSVVDFKTQLDFKWKILPNLNYAFDGAYRFVKTGQEHSATEFSNAALAYRAGTIYDPRGQNSNMAESNRFLWKDAEDPNALPVSILPRGGFYDRTERSLTTYYMRNTLSYDMDLNNINHKVNIMALTELRSIDRQNSFNSGVGYQFDQGGIPFWDPNYFKYLAQSGGDYYGMDYGHDRYLAYMLRGAYSYKSKYSLNSTVRYDGSNKLGESRVARWLPTWNVSGAWNVDQESFFFNNVKFMDQLRLRATYGLVASMGSATNSSVIYRNGTTHRKEFSNRENAIEISSLENSELTWEKQYEANIGFDAGFMNNRLTLTMDFYNRKGFDLIGTFRTSGIDGQASKQANYADMKSHGIEATLQYRIVDNRDFKWDFRGNIAYNVSKITDLQNLPRIWDMVRQEGGALVGYPVRSLFSIYFQELNEIGLPVFKNHEGKDAQTDVNMQSTTLGDLVFSGQIDPKLTGGAYSSLSWKGFQLSGLVTFSTGNVVRLSPAFKTRYSDMDASNNALLARWVIRGDEILTNAPVIPGPGIANQISGYPFNNYNYSDIRVAKGDFIRLKQIILSYQLPAKVAGKFFARNASIAAVANNPWLIYSDKKLQGQDPEFFESGGVALPIQKQISLSLKLGF